MRQLSTFQIIVLGVCVALTLIGVGVFASSGGLTGGSEVGPVVIWGTLESDQMQALLDALRSTDKTFRDVTYIEKQASTYTADLINAMAAGRGPDLFLVSQTQVYAFGDKILLIPYGEVSQGSFSSSFVNEAELFLTPGGILALPFTIDPLVMYWNRNLFASAGVANPPQYWNDFLDLAPKISTLDGTSAVKRSAVALGTWSNIANAKEILSTLFLQAGDPIIVQREDGFEVTLGTRAEGRATDPASSALRFYTEFANPSKTTYSWNRSLPRSNDMFASGDVAVYFGFASELNIFAARNPNLNYAVATMPQIEGSNSRATFGRIVGMAIPRTSSNAPGALEVAKKLSAAASINILSQITGLPPVRRDVALDTSQNPAMAVFQQSALVARGWLDPSPTATNLVFQSMIESVISGKEEPGAAVGNAARELEKLVGR